MGADTVVYCLERLTDYDQFERLCHDLMCSEGYPGIEPLGGVKDKGRDALHVHRATSLTTIFAYSVQEGWRAKLGKDAEKIRRHGHPCHRLAFLCNADFTAHERDEAVNFVRQEFGWELELYGLERLRVLLTTRHARLVSRHPQIFPPAFFPPTAYGLDGGVVDCLFIDYADEDAVLATWLARRLTVVGYRVWCRGLALLGGESSPATQDRIIRNHACHMLALYSQAALRQPDVAHRRATALLIGSERGTDFLIPLAVERLTPDQLDWQTKNLAFIPFDQGWGHGLARLLQKLDSVGCPRPIQDGAAVATRTFGLANIISPGPEIVFSNCLQVTRLPPVIHRFKADHPPDEDARRALAGAWAFRCSSPGTFLSFHQPPQEQVELLGLRVTGGARWADVRDIDGINSANLLPELIRKSLLVRCCQRGLHWCRQTQEAYFPPGLFSRGRLRYTRPNGHRTHVSVVGERKYWRPQRSEYYRYHVAPGFRVRQDLTGEYTALVRLRVRVTDTQGQLLPRRSRNSRRKHLCRGWWNDDWLNRVLAVCQYLAEGGDEICVGRSTDELVKVSPAPFQWQVSPAINEEGLPKAAWERDTSRTASDEDADDAEPALE